MNINLRTVKLTLPLNKECQFLYGKSYVNLRAKNVNFSAVKVKLYITKKGNFSEGIVALPCNEFQ